MLFRSNAGGGVTHNVEVRAADNLTVTAQIQTADARNVILAADNNGDHVGSVQITGAAVRSGATAGNTGTLSVSGENVTIQGTASAPSPVGTIGTLSRTTLSAVGTLQLLAGNGGSSVSASLTSSGAEDVTANRIVLQAGNNGTTSNAEIVAAASTIASLPIACRPSIRSMRFMIRATRSLRAGWCFPMMRLERNSSVNSRCVWPVTSMETRFIWHPTNTTCR